MSSGFSRDTYHVKLCGSAVHAPLGSRQGTHRVPLSRGPGPCNDARVRLNHLAIGMPPDEFDDGRRREIADFYREVFGWYEFTPDEAGDPMILAFDEFGQYLYLIAEEPPLRAAPMAHVGVQVDSRAELEAILDRARAYAARDPRVHITEPETAPQRSNRGRVTLTNCYIGYLLPVMVELQHIEFAPFEHDPS